MKFMDISNDLRNFIDILEICDTSLDSIEGSFNGLLFFASYIRSMALSLLIEEAVV